MFGVLIRRGNAERYREEGHVKRDTELGVMQLQAKVHQGMLGAATS